MALQLNGPKSGQLQEALKSAFLDPGSFQRLLFHKMDLNVYDFVPFSANRETMFFETINETNRTYRTDELIAAAREANPTNEVLHEFSRQFGLTSLDKDRPVQEFERIVIETNSWLDPAVWRKKLAEIEPRVCRIEITSNEGMIYGTGFLVGPNTVLTNYHVMEPVLKGEKGETTADGLSAKPGNVQCRFDYTLLPNKTNLEQGVIYQLDTKWEIDSSPSSPLDQLPPVDKLDYIFLRLTGSPGEGIVGNLDPRDGVKRGWISIPETPYDFKKDSPIFIMQHPKGDSLKLAFATNGVIEVNGNKTRVKHRVNTEPGSSGSPCFSQNWDLIALHHSGDPDFDPAHKPTYNEAIPMQAILDLIKQRGIKAQIDS